MPANATHIIRQQHYQLKVATQQQGRAMQQQLQEFNLQQLLPALNTHFNEWFGSDNEVVTIDKLEIDLGRIHPSAPDNEWLEKIIGKLGEKLKPAQTTGILPETESINIEKKAGAIHAWEALIYFLQNGLLPNGIYQNIESVFAALYQMELTDKSIIKHGLIKQANELVLERLLLLNDEQSHFIIRLFVPDISLADWNDWIAVLNDRLDTLFIKHKFNQQQKVFIKQQLFLFLFDRLIQSSQAEQLFWQPLKAAAEIALTKIADKLQQVPDDRLLNKYPEHPADKTKNKPVSKKDEELITPEGIFVSNTGICLTAPYLPVFFQALSFTDGAFFLSTYLQQRAIHVLHFLSTGEEDASEEKLVFAKLLCGWPLQMPLMERIELTETERRETIELLQSIIEHWAALKSTSPDGLREGFLQRSGKLSEGNDNYLLQVEHQSIDILLEYIPWQFRIIKLPWMKRRIEVEWY